MADSMKAMEISKGESVPQEMVQWFINDRDHRKDWETQAQEDYDFVAGRQWSEEEIQALKEKARPIVTFNRIGPVIDSVHGQEIGNRRQVRYIPREMGDVKPNEVLTSAADWFREQSTADDQESDAFLDTLICGMGWTETRIDYDESAEGKPDICRIDPLEMFWDFDAKKRNLSDLRRVWRVRRVPLSEARAMFPNATADELDADWTTVQSINDLGREDASGGGTDQNGDQRVTLVHVQWIERESYYIAYDPIGGAQAEFSPQEFSDANKRMKTLIGTEMQGVMRRRKVRKQAFLGKIVLGSGRAPCPDGFSFQCITAKRDRNKNTWYGIVRAMKDPQRWANKWLAQMMHIMNSNSKGGLLAEKGAFEDQRQAEKSWADPSAITFLKDGAIANSRVKEKPPAQFPAGFQQLTEFAISSIRDSSGVSVELLGLRSADQAASLEYQRRQAGLTILQPLFDSLKHYRILQGRVMLYYIQHDLSDGRLIRIVGKESEQYVPLVKQASAEYDIIVDDAPTSPNQKEAIWAMLIQLLPMLKGVMPPQMMVKLLKYSPFPSSMVEEIEQAGQQMANDPHAQQQAMLQMRGLAAQVEETQSKAALNKAKAMETVRGDPSQPDTGMEWQKALLDALTKIEVAQISAAAQNDGAAISGQIEQILGMAGFASDHIMQIRQLAHDRAVAQMQPKQPAQ